MLATSRTTKAAKPKAAKKPAKKKPKKTWMLPESFLATLAPGGRPFGVVLGDPEPATPEHVDLSDYAPKGVEHMGEMLWIVSHGTSDGALTSIEGQLDLPAPADLEPVFTLMAATLARELGGEGRRVIGRGKDAGRMKAVWSVAGREVELMAGDYSDGFDGFNRIRLNYLEPYRLNPNDLDW